MRAVSVDREGAPARLESAFPIARPVAPANGDSTFLETIERLTSALDARIADLDGQLAALRRLMTPAAPVLVTPVARGEATAVANCLGSFQFRVGGVSAIDWRSGRARSLFQYLVSHRGRAVPNDTLIHALWPEPGAVAPGSSLKVAVHGLRQALKQIGADESIVQVTAHNASYQLNACSLWVDVEEFERCYLLGRERQARDQPLEALGLFTRAAELYRGDFLEELSDDWLLFRREALKDQYLFVLSSLAQAAVAVGDYQSGITRCQQLLTKDRCREDAYRLLMICHGRLGQRGRARAWFQLCCQTLRGELDCEPDDETCLVYRQAISGKA